MRLLSEGERHMGMGRTGDSRMIRGKNVLE